MKKMSCQLGHISASVFKQFHIFPKKIGMTFLFIFLISLFPSCNIKITTGKTQSANQKITELGTTDSIFLEQMYITESLDFALYNAWLRLDEALALNDSSTKYNSNKTQETIATAQNDFLRELERGKESKTYRIANSMYGIQNQISDMEEACKNLDAQTLSRLVTAFYISKGLIYQKSGTVFMQMIILMGILILLVLALLFFYHLTYARRIEIEKILKATNKGQEEERRRIALELHDSVAQQMRYVSILAEKVSDEELAKEIKSNQSECIENL